MLPDERDLDDEIRGHLALDIADRVARGQQPDAARRDALRDFGYPADVRQAMRRTWVDQPTEWWLAWRRDLTLAARTLWRARGLALAVIVTLALGIGANAAIFSVVRDVLLRPLTNADADRLVHIRHSAAGLDRASAAFSVPEITDLRATVTTVEAFGDFSTIDLPLVGLSDPQVVNAGVVGGNYFDVMGLRATLGRLLSAADDRPDATGAVVLTHRFWIETLGGDPAVVGRDVRLGGVDATVVGVLQPTVSYPVETEVFSNIVTSPHHLEATMVTVRTHRMTDLFGRLRPTVTLDEARADIEAAYAAMTAGHPDAYPPSSQLRVAITPLREQITAPARPILLTLLAAAGLVLIVAVANAANLILARSVSRQAELDVRAALGASAGALRRTLLAESLMLGAAGAAVGIVIAHPLVAVVGRFASRYTIERVDSAVDPVVLAAGALLAVIAALALAYVPALPQTLRAGSSSRPSASRLAAPRLQTLASIQVAVSCVLLAIAGTFLSQLLALQTAPTAFDTRQVLAIDVPTPFIGFRDDGEMERYVALAARVEAVPGVERVALGMFVPWRDTSPLLSPIAFTVEGRVAAPGEDDPRARLRVVSPSALEVLGVPLLDGRDFLDSDDRHHEPVVIVSDSLARRWFPAGDAVGKTMWWTDAYFGAKVPRRIVGIAADVDDERLTSDPVPTVYHPTRQLRVAGRWFVSTTGNPYDVVPAIRRTVQDVAPEQPVERAATLGDVRKTVLGPERLNAAVISGFAAVALAITMVGVAGVLAYSAAVRRREFGIRVALGATRRQLIASVLRQGGWIVGVGIAAGLGVALATASFVRLPALVGGAAILAAAVMVVALVPAWRASRVDAAAVLRADS